MFTEYTIAKAALALLATAYTAETTVFIGRLGLTDREVWRFSSAGEPICIARLPIHKTGSSWRELKIAVSPVRDEILVVSSVDEGVLNATNNSWHIHAKLQRLSFQGKLLATYQFDFSDPDGCGFGFTGNGHPFAASRYAKTKEIKKITWDGAAISDARADIAALLDWDVLTARWSELSLQTMPDAVVSELNPVRNGESVRLTQKELLYQGKMEFARPAGVAEWTYGSRFETGVMLTALESNYRDCRDWTRAMAVYSYSFESKIHEKICDGAYAVVARSGRLPVIHNP